MIHILSTHALMFRNPENQEQVHHVRPSVTPQQAPDWIKDDPYFALCKKSKSIKEVILVVDDEEGEEEPMPARKSSKAKAKSDDAGLQQS